MDDQDRRRSSQAREDWQIINDPDLSAIQDQEDELKKKRHQMIMKIEEEMIEEGRKLKREKVRLMNKKNLLEHRSDHLTEKVKRFPHRMFSHTRILLFHIGKCQFQENGEKFECFV